GLVLDHVRSPLPTVLDELDAVDQQRVARRYLDLEPSRGCQRVLGDEFKAELQAVVGDRQKLSRSYTDRLHLATVRHVEHDIENTLGKGYFVHYMLLIFT